MDGLKRYQSFYPYTVSTPAAELPVTLTILKTHLKLDPTDTSQDGYLTLLIQAVTAFAEGYMRRVLINTEFEVLKDYLTPVLELRRSPFVSLQSFKYTKSGSLLDVDSSLYYLFPREDYHKILLKDDSTYPTDGDDILRGVVIKFIAGYAASTFDFESKYPDIVLAILNHVAAVYENRGDCDKASIITALPKTSKDIYNKYRIIEASCG